ncbi:O-antigen ligase family protein [Elstera sp.]|jgi:O-antigen ligase|uniref:O-antigen ligase family protein n=1 Tax=Elstera sp. TaxID=1916664 RepID=UPI0037C0E29A
MSRLAPVSLALGASILSVLPLFALPNPLVMLGLAVAIPAAVMATRVPFLLCLGFVIFSFFRIHEAFPVLMPLRIPQLLAIPTLGVLVWHFFGTRRLKPYWSRELSWFAAFFGLVTVGVIFASNKPLALAYWTATYVKIGIMTLAIAWLTTEPGHFARASRALVLAGLAVSYVTLSNKANGIGLVEGTRVTIGRDMQSVLGDPNDLSLVLLFPMAFAVSLATTKGLGKLSNLFGAVAVVAVLMAILATQSRGGLLGIMTVFGVFGLRLVKSKLLLGAVGGVAMLVLFAAAGISGRSSGGAAEDGIDESAMGRIYAWGAAIQMATTRPLTGVGLDNFLSNYYFYSSHWDGKNHAVHSTWFGVLGETGFPGLAVFIGMIVVSLRSSLKASRILDRTPGVSPNARAMGRALVAGLAACCVAGTFLTQGFTWPFYIQIALTAAIARYANQVTQNATESATVTAPTSENPAVSTR